MEGEDRLEHKKTEKERLIFHVDVNSAYLSWEAAKRVEEGKEDIRRIPAAIGGDREKRTGIILAKSIPAQQYGVTTGEPVSLALRKCPELLLVPPDFSLYEKNSRAFMDICRKYAPVLQKFSVDECFLDMTGTELIYPDPVELAHRIKNEVRDTLGFTVNIGIGSNKLLAKMASDFEKPDKVHTLFLGEIREKMWPLPVGELLYVGKTSKQKLLDAHIKTIGDLAESELAFIQRILGEKGGKQAYEYANGIDPSPVSEEPEEPKGYSISTTLEEDVTTLEQAGAVFLSLVDSVARRMRADDAKAYCIGITIRFSKIANSRGNTPSQRFTNKSHQRKFQVATDVTNEIYRISMELFKELWHGEPLRLLGVSLTDLTKDGYEQLSLFSDGQREKARKLDAAMDSLRDKYGSDIIFRAGVADGERVGRKYRAQLENEKE